MSPFKRCRTKLGIPIKYIVLSEFMLNPVFVGNYRLEIDDLSFVQKPIWEKQQTQTEKVADFILKFCEYYTTRWILTVFNRG